MRRLKIVALILGLPFIVPIVGVLAFAKVWEQERERKAKALDQEREEMVEVGVITTTADEVLPLSQEPRREN